MAIPESQLDTWSAQGSVTQSKNTYATVKNALESSQAPYEGRSYEVFLQGSYGNHTNIYAESDVDVVIRLLEIMRSDLSLLPPDQQASYHQAYRTATYTFNAFKEGVHTRLKTVFGRDSITTGDKAFHIEPTSSRRSSDVVTCQEYRRYIRFNTITDQEYIPGILIPNTSTGDVINYPKVHSENLTAKNQATHGWLKPMIRIFKNMRNRLIEERAIAEDTACSYYVEGMVYNVPDPNFGGTWAHTFCNCLNWLRDTDRSRLLCASRQYWLLGNSNAQWTATQCDRFLNALAHLWTSW